MTRAAGRLGQLLAALGIALVPTLLVAQGQRLTDLSVAGFPLTVTETLVADYDAGVIDVGMTTFTVDLTRNVGGGGFSPRRTTVNVRCAAPCPTVGTAPATLRWRLASGGTFVSLTTTFAFVESRVATFGGTNDPWSNGIAWQYALDWATAVTSTEDPVFTIEFELVVTAP